MLRLLAAEIRGVATGLALVAFGVLVAISVDIGVPGQSLLQSLRFHIGAASLVLPFGLFATGAGLRGGLLLLAIIASVGQGLLPVWEGYQRREALADSAAIGTLEVMSFNVLAHNSRGGELGRFIASQPMDVVITMESSGLSEAMDDMRATYPHTIGCGPNERCDTALFSRLPLLRAEIRRLGDLERDRIVVATVEVGGQVVTIVGVHLSKPYFDEMAEVELYQIAGLLNSLQGPIVLAGDFNSAPWSDAMVRFLEATDFSPAAYPPATWPVRAGALGVPIDNVFTRGALITGLEALPDSIGSNHRGLVAQVDIFTSTDE